MLEINVKDARNKLSSLLDRAEKGDEIIITRRGKKVARLVPLKSESKLLPPLKDFRASIGITGRSLGATVAQEREEGRY